MNRPKKGQTFLKERAHWEEEERTSQLGPLNENELQGSRQLNERRHYGSVHPSYIFQGPRERFVATSEEYPLRRTLSLDSKIEEEVCEALMKSRYIDASNIEVNVEDGTVILSGTVEHRLDKVAAEMAIEEIRGVLEIQNKIKVKKWGDYSDRPYQRDSSDKNPGPKDKDNYF